MEHNGTEDLNPGVEAYIDYNNIDPIIPLEDIELEDDDNKIIENLFHNYEYLFNMFLPYVLRSYEQPTNWYYVVAKPYNDKYEKYRSWYESYQAVRTIKRKFEPSTSLITREKEAAKVHLNMLCTSEQDLTKFHDKNCFKYRYHVQKITGLYGRASVLMYILKEAKQRRMQEFKDYFEDCLYNKQHLKLVTLPFK